MRKRIKKKRRKWDRVLRVVYSTCSCGSCLKATFGTLLLGKIGLLYSSRLNLWDRQGRDSCKRVLIDSIKKDLGLDRRLSPTSSLSRSALRRLLRNQSHVIPYSLPFLRIIIIILYDPITHLNSFPIVSIFHR